MATLQLETLFVKITADSSTVLKEFRRAERAATSFSAVIASVAKTATIASAAIGAVATASLKEYAKFDQALTESQAIMKLTGDQAERMKDVAIQSGLRGKFGPEELAKAYYFLASAGLSAEQSIAALPAVADFAAAGALKLEKATELAANIQSVMGLRSRDAAQNMKNLVRVTDILVKANNVANANVLQFAKSLSSDAGPTFRQYRKSVEEATATIAAYADQGIKAEVAGSAAGRALRFIANKAIENEAVFKRHNITVFDTNGELRNMASIVMDLERALGPLNDESKTLLLEQLGFESRMQRTILPLIGMSGRIRKYQQILESAGGTTKEVAEKQMGSFTNQLNRMINTLKVAAITIGDMLAPAFLVLGDAVRVVAGLWVIMPDVLKNVLVFGTAVIGMFLTMTAVLFGVGVALNLLFGGVGIVAGVIILAVVGYLSIVAGWVGVIVGLVLYLTNGFKGVREAVNKVAEELRPVQEALQSLFKTAGEQAKVLADTIKKALAGVWGDIALESKVNWLQIRDDVVMAIYFMEFSLLNFGRVAEFVWLNLQLTALGVIVDITSLWDDKLRQAAIVSQPVFANLFYNIGVLAGATFRFMAKNFNAAMEQMRSSLKQLIGNLVSLGSNLPDILRGKKGFEDVWAPMTVEFKEEFEGFKLPQNLLKPVIEPLLDPKLWERELSPMELQLKKQIDDIGGPLAVDFANFLAGKLKKNKTPEEEAEEKGKDIGESIGKGMGKELQRFDAALFRSAEAISRFQEYRDRLRDPDSVAQDGERLRRFDVAQARTPEEAQRRHKQEDLLKRIANATEEQLRRNPIKLDEADLD